MARTVISNKPAARVVAKRVSLRINKPNPASTKAAAPKRLIDTSILDYFSRTSSPLSARIKVKSKELEAVPVPQQPTEHPNRPGMLLRGGDDTVEPHDVLREISEQKERILSNYGGSVDKLPTSMRHLFMRDDEEMK